MLTSLRATVRKSRSAFGLLATSVALSGLPRPSRAADSPLQFVEITEPTAPVERARAGKPARTTSRPSGLRQAAPPTKLAFVAEGEPNNTSATATPLVGSDVAVRADVYPAADIDFYSFAGVTGERVYAATQTFGDASGSGDSALDLLDVDGTTVLETDANDGTFGANSSTIAGAVLPSAGTFFLRVRHNLATGTIRPYDLYFKKVSGIPVAEVEPNDTTVDATALPASGWVSGTVTATTGAGPDFFSLNLAAGDTVFLSLDMNPERDANVWNGRLAFGLFGNPPASLLLVANDANAGSAANPNSEAFFYTVKAAGTYYVYVDSVVAAGLGPLATYNLAVSVHPAATPAGTCTTYTSTNVPQTIPAGPGSVSSTLTIPGNPRIDDLDVTLNITHTAIADLDVHLISPAGNDNGLFTDPPTTAGQTAVDLTVDDEAALPFAFGVSAGMVNQPEPAYRLDWFDGENAGGTWTLQIRDDMVANGGTLNSWSLKVCEPPPPASCAAGFLPVTVFTTDFESGAAGFTHAGVADEWELGLPATATTGGVAGFNTCNSGVNCWKTDLDNTYNANSTQDLRSPNINLAGLSAPVVVSWAQRYSLETATFDHATVDLQQVGGGAAVRLFEWTGATMTDGVGNPTVSIGESSGWSALSRRADSLAGLNSEVRFHVDTDANVQLSGLAIDDVSVTACRPATADLAVTVTDGVTTAVPGGSVTYTITASNAGVDPASPVTVSDTFPAALTCTWTCVGAGGGTCTAAGAGNIADAAALPVGGSVTYTASCAIAASAVGTLSNTATVASALTTDPVPANNSATDTDTLTPQADLSITKTDGQESVAPGPVTYTIVASNAGPSNAPGAAVTDTLPGNLTAATWTCAATGGASCTAIGAGNINDVANLPAGGTATYTLTGTVAAGAGPLSNTATVAPPAGVADPNPANNSATDTTTVGLRYYTVTPCRVVDTRGGAPIAGPALQGGETRAFGFSGQCGIPATAKAVGLNVTVTQASAPGSVTLFAGGASVPSTSSINYSTGQTRANNVVVGLSATGEVAAFVGQAGGTTVELILDVNGYFE